MFNSLSKKNKERGTFTLKQHLPRKSKLSWAVEKPIHSSYKVTRQWFAGMQNYPWIKSCLNWIETGDIETLTPQEKTSAKSPLKSIHRL